MVYKRQLESALLGVSMKATRTIVTPLILILTSLSCGTRDVTTNQPIGCGQGTAIIAVWDGFLTAMCGCEESSPQAITMPASLTCTMAAPATIVFQYQGESLAHQIVSSEAPAIITSPPSDPYVRADKTFSYSVTIESAGTYRFMDLFDPRIKGQIVVQ